MNIKDTDIENKRKQAIEALVADSTTFGERLIKAEDFGETCRILHNHGYLTGEVREYLRGIETAMAAQRGDVA